MRLKVLIKSIIIAIIFVAVSCDRENKFPDTGKITIDNVKHGDCKNTSNTRSAEAEEIHFIAVSATRLKVVHRNVVFNCCPKSLIVECEADGNTINIVEREEESACNCICPYDLEFVINSLRERTYTIKIKGYKPFDIKFNKSTNVIIYPEKE
ncbi:MAG: hypothetical protein ACOYEG_06575 [Petrimonas sp.]|jgi:hypothetical protein|nr:MAG: hypothetical protein BWZ00_00138 [Bacteroidetes bacterium ADurb.BinA174]